MSGGGRKMLTKKEAADLWETRETWCALEPYRDRKQRRISGKLFISNMFGEFVPIVTNEERCTFKVDEPEHKEKRHFKEQHLSQVKGSLM